MLHQHAQKCLNNKDNNGNEDIGADESILMVISTDQLEVATQWCWSHTQMKSELFQCFMPIFIISSQLHHQPDQYHHCHRHRHRQAPKDFVFDKKMTK